MTQTDEKRPLNKWSGSSLQVADRFSFASNPQMGMYVYDVQQEEMQREWTAFFEIQSEELETQVKSMEWNEVLDALSSTLSRRSLACFLSPVEIVHESAVFSGRLHLIMATCQRLRDAGRKLFQSSPSKSLQTCAFPYVSPV
jgi:hypothetical protein